MKDGFDATGKLIVTLESLGIDYLVVGSLSSMAYGIPRSTKDADLVLSLEQNALSKLTNALGPEFQLGAQGSLEMVTGTLRYHLHVPEIAFEIELFLLSDDPHDQARFNRRQRIFSPQLDNIASIPTAEDVIIMKLRWFGIAKRGKDQDDVRDIIAVQGDEALDWHYIHKWTAEHGTRELLDEIRASIPKFD